MTWKENLIKYGLVGLVGVVIGAGLFSRCNKKEDFISGVDNNDFVYQGSIDGRGVAYKENADFSIDGNKRKVNMMSVKRNDDEYNLIDMENQTGIEWKLNIVPNYASDKLEKVIIKRGNTSYTFRIEDINDSTIEGQKVKTMIEKGTQFYNNLRTKIREKKRTEYSDSLKNVEEFFSNVN